MLLLAAAPARALSSFEGFTMQLNGYATMSGADLQLTPDHTSRNGSAWSTSAVSTANSFVSRYRFSLTGTAYQADGVAFVMQSQSTTALGGMGNHLGLIGIPSYVAAVIRTFTYDLAGLETESSTAPAAGAVLGNCSSVSGQYSVAYEASTHVLSLYGTVNACGHTTTISRSLSVDLAAKFGSTMYIGFTGATGTNSATQLITEWTFVSLAPAAHYPMNELAWSGSSGDVADASGYARHGTSQYGAAAGDVCSPWGTFAGVAGSTPARVRVPYTAALNPAGSFSVMAWARASGGVGSTRSAVHSRNRGATTPYKGWALWAHTSNNWEFWLARDNNTGDTQGVFGPVSLNTWVHLAATFDAQSGPDGFGAYTGLLTLYRDGVAVYSRADARYVPNDSQPLIIGSGGFNPGTSADGDTLGFSIYPFQGDLDEVKLFDQPLSAAQVAAQMTRSTACKGPHHLVLQHASGQGLTCTPTTLTVQACADSACTTPYTAGVSGTLTASGSGMVVNWPAGAGFSIGAGSSSTTVSLQQSTPGSVTLGSTGLWPAASASTSCNFGSPSCTHSAADAGFVLDVPDHVADAVRSFTVSAVRKSDSSPLCTPAFASVNKTVTLRCSYANPASGTLPLRVNGSALNAGANAAAACDGSGQAISLAFDGSGQASATLQYADVGRLSLSASYSGSSGGETSLAMSGSDSFTVAPHHFAVSPTAGARVAGSAFSASVSALNWNGALTPNFGRETPAESVTLSWVRSQPQGAGAVNGSFSGSVGAFSGGSASASNLVWSEVGHGELSASLSSGSYLGSGLHAAGSSAGAPLWCANEFNTCVLPAGSTATVYYGAAGRVVALAGLSGSVACNNATFGDPYVGFGKMCWYVPTGGSSAASSGAFGPFIPHHFTSSATPACGSFSYAGQPFAATLTARSASGSVTVNYDGSVTTSPNFAHAVTLSDGATLGLGSLSGASVAASAFFGGSANATPAYSFSAKHTAPQTLVLRATDSDGVSSNGHAEGTMPLRSGRLRLSNASARAGSALQVPLHLEYWDGLAWLTHAADSCTTLATAQVALSNPRDARGQTLAASTSAATLTLSAGLGTLTLNPATPASTSVSFDLSLNLGSSASDASCLASHPASTGAGLPWLRSRWGDCAAGWAADPAGHVSFGIYRSDSGKTIHVRELY